MRKARLLKNKDQLIDAEQVRDGTHSRYEDFIDPEHEFRVVYVNGAKNGGVPHFRLYLSLKDYLAMTPERRNKYDFLRDQRHYDESRWHRYWELMASSFCKVEYYVRGADRKYKRADAFYEQGNLAIEFQHSFIKEDFEERNTFYSSLGIPIIWLYDLTMMDAVPMGDGVYEIVENNAKGFFRIAEDPKNLRDYPVFIQTRNKMIFRVSKLDRKEIGGTKESTIRLFKPDLILTEEEFIDGIKTGRLLDSAESCARKTGSVYDLWKPEFDRMVIQNEELAMTIMICADGKRMNTDHFTGHITYLYVTWDSSSKSYSLNSWTFYQLSREKASNKHWVLLKSENKKSE